MVGAWGAMGRSSTRGQGRQGLSGWRVMFEQAAGLHVTWGSPKTSRALVQVTVDTDMSKFSALKAGFVVMGVVTGEGHIVVASGPPDFGTSDGNLFFLGQRG